MLRFPRGEPLRLWTSALRVMSVPAHPIQGPRSTWICFHSNSHTRKSPHLESSHFHLDPAIFLQASQAASLCLSWEQVRSWHRNANIPMGTFSCLSLYSKICSCLLRGTCLSAEVATVPSHRVIERKQAVNLSCDPISGHNSLFLVLPCCGDRNEAPGLLLRGLCRTTQGYPKADSQQKGQKGRLLS